jgi:hypothetical protein
MSLLEAIEDLDRRCEEVVAMAIDGDDANNLFLVYRFAVTPQLLTSLQRAIFDIIEEKDIDIFDDIQTPDLFRSTLANADKAREYLEQVLFGFRETIAMPMWFQIRLREKIKRRELLTQRDVALTLRQNDPKFCRFVSVYLIAYWKSSRLDDFQEQYGSAAAHSRTISSRTSLSHSSRSSSHSSIEPNVVDIRIAMGLEPR